MILLHEILVIVHHPHPQHYYDYFSHPNSYILTLYPHCHQSPHPSIFTNISFHPDDPDPRSQPDAGVLAMGGGQTTHFQGDEVRHGEHVPGDHHHDQDDNGEHLRGDDDDGLMVRMVSQSISCACFCLEVIFCAILTVIDKRRAGGANFRIFLADDAVGLFSWAVACPLEYSI